MRTIHVLLETVPALIVAAAVVGCGSETSPVEVQTSALKQAVQIQDELKPLRASHERYRDINNAIADGFQLGYHNDLGQPVVTGCVQKVGVGAMGYHYFNWAKMDDPKIDEMDPEVLVYHTGPDGELKLGAVEWVVPKVAWEAAGNTAPPSVYGHEFTVINPVLNWYVGHAWLYDDNPLGIFYDWNPDVTCP